MLLGSYIDTALLDHLTTVALH